MGHPGSKSDGAGGSIVKLTSRSVSDTVERLKSLIAAKGILVFSDGDQTKVAYTAPKTLASRYGLNDELAARLAGIDGLTDALVEG